MKRLSERMPGNWGPWKIKTTDSVYKDAFVQVELDQVVRPDKQPGQHVVVHLKPGVCVLPIDEGGNVWLTREFHYGIGRESLEGISGGIEQGEEPIQTARRELAEEVGLAASEWQLLTTTDPFTSVVVSPTRLYVARGLSPVEPSPEGTELIEPVNMPLTTALEKIYSGEITHSPTCILIFWASQT